MGEHTPTPWYADPDLREGYEWNVHIVEHDRPNNRICFMSNGPNSETNAAFIVKAVNSHDALVDALEGWLAFAEEELGEFDLEECDFNQTETLCHKCESAGCINLKIRIAREALAKAATS